MQGNLPDEMQSRVLMPSGRGRRSAAAIAAAALLPSTASSSSSAPAPSSSDFYNTLASLSAMTASSGSAAADLMRFSSMPYGLGLGSLGLTNPMYAASLASLGILPGMLSIPGFDGEGDKDVNSGCSKEQDRSTGDDSDIPTSSLHPSFPYLYNPLIYSQLYAQSLAAATASNFGLPGPFGSLGLGLDTATEHSVTDESKSELKMHKSRKTTSTTVPSSVAVKEAHRPVPTYTEAISHMTEDQPSSRSSYSLEALAGGVPDQSEPEDLSVLSKKRRETADNMSSSKAAASDVATRLSSHEDVEDLRRKPSVPAVILSVPESRNLVIGTSSPCRVSPLAEKLISACSSTAKDSVVTAPAGGKLLGSQGGRSRSRLIDSIGTKLMARKQKVKSDDAGTSLLCDVEPPPASTAQLLAEPPTSSNPASDDCEQTDSSAVVSLVADKLCSSETAETDNTEQAPL